MSLHGGGVRLARSEARSEGAFLEAFRAFQEACLAPGDHVGCPNVVGSPSEGFAGGIEQAS